MMDLISIIRSILIFLHLDLNKGLEYDRLTKIIMKKIITPESNCIDVGCHKGEILNQILKSSPNGLHFAFEPIPHLFNQLQHKFPKTVKIFPYALSDNNGVTTFNYVKNAPSYSGLKKRTYEIEKPDIEEINVEMKRLDDCVPQELKIQFIKIDVEGGELGVLKGAKRIIMQSKPFILFECGIGASDYYGTTSKDIFSFINNDNSMDIFLLTSWIRNGTALTEEQFHHYFTTNKEYYFLACSQ